MMATNMVMLMRERSNGECSGTHYYGTLPTSGPTRRFRMSSRNGEEAPRREEKGEHELPWFVWRTSEKPLDGEPIKEERRLTVLDGEPIDCKHTRSSLIRNGGEYQKTDRNEY
mgnify:FL=1